VVQHGVVRIRIGRKQHPLPPEVADDTDRIGIWRIALIGDATQVEIEFQPSCYFGADIRTDVVLLVVEISGTEESLLEEVAARDIVLRLLVAAGDADVMLLLRGVIRENQRVPVRYAAGSVAELFEIL